MCVCALRERFRRTVCLVSKRVKPFLAKSRKNSHFAQREGRMSQFQCRCGAIRLARSQRSRLLLYPPNDDFAPHAGDAAVSAHQGAVSRCAPLLPHGRLLRAVLRRRRRGGAAAGHHPHGARAFRWQAHSDGRRAVPCRGRLSRQAGGERPRGGHLRTDRRSGGCQRPGGAPRGAHRHARHAGGRRPARAGPGERAGRRQAGGRGLGLRVAESLLRRFRRRRRQGRRRACRELGPAAASGSALASRRGLRRCASAAPRRDGVRRRARLPALDGALRHRQLGSLRHFRWRRGHRRRLCGVALRPGGALPGSGVR